MLARLQQEARKRREALTAEQVSRIQNDILFPPTAEEIEERRQAEQRVGGVSARRCLDFLQTPACCHPAAGLAVCGQHVTLCGAASHQATHLAMRFGAQAAVFRGEASVPFCRQRRRRPRRSEQNGSGWRTRLGRSVRQQLRSRSRSRRRAPPRSAASSHLCCHASCQAACMVSVCSRRVEGAGTEHRNAACAGRSDQQYDVHAC